MLLLALPAPSRRRPQPLLQSCGAAARVRATLPSGAELLFCQHHANEHEAKLIAQAAVLVPQLATLPLRRFGVVDLHAPHPALDKTPRALDVSPDGNWLAYAIDRAGDERHALRFRDLRTGEEAAETVEDVSYGFAWAVDSATCWYTLDDDA